MNQHNFEHSLAHLYAVYSAKLARLDEQRTRLVNEYFDKEAEIYAARQATREQEEFLGDRVGDIIATGHTEWFDENVSVSIDYRSQEDEARAEALRWAEGAGFR